MSYTFKLDVFNHDVKIDRTGHLERIVDADEVCQRIKVSLWHYLGEYFLNVGHGIPYYRGNDSEVAIMGSKVSTETICNILRQKILEVPGVLQILKCEFTNIGRNYYFSCQVSVESEFNRVQEVALNNISIGGLIWRKNNMV